MIELTEVMQQMVDQYPGEPLWLIDPRTRQAYVLLRGEDYDRVKGILGDEDEWDGVDVGRLIAEAMREDDENDPLLESYQEGDGPK